MSIFAGVSPALVGSFFAGDVNDRRGVPVAARNVDADVKAEIIAGAAAGGPPGVGIFEFTGGADQENGFMAFDAAFLGGVFVG